MKAQIKDLLVKLKPLVRFVKRYAVFIYMLIMFGIFGFLILRVNYYSQAEPTEEAIQEKLQTAKRPKVDAAALDKIQQLQSQNIQVNSLFDQARKNPFNE